MQHFITLIYI